MLTGIEFDGIHSKEYGLTVSELIIGNPSKIKIQERIPFSNVNYDFSNLYGGQEYEERPITITFNILNKGAITNHNFKENYTHFNIFETQVLNWIMRPSTKRELRVDTLPGYYFLAEVVESPSSEFKFVAGELTVTFTAYPFKISELEEGNDIWDTFNFLLDYAQITEYTINGSKSITLYNGGAGSIRPTIRASAQMTIKRGNTTYQIPIGESQSYDLMLTDLENELLIEGNGTISFHFHKEVI